MSSGELDTMEPSEVQPNTICTGEGPPDNPSREGLTDNSDSDKKAASSEDRDEIHLTQNGRLMNPVANTTTQKEISSRHDNNTASLEAIMKTRKYE